MDRISSGDRYKGTMSTIEKYALVVLEQLSGALAYMHSLNVVSIWNVCSVFNFLSSM